MVNTVAFHVTDPSQVAEARRLGTELAVSLGFDETAAGRVAIVLAEAATNLIKHANGGELLLTPLEGEGRAGLEIVSLDKGPGMANIDACLRDGFSTAGSLGTGLGAISRLVDTFDIYSATGSGTVLLARIWSKAKQERSALTGFELGAISVPIPGEKVCGDAWSILHQAGNPKIIVADGLGHGIGAADASTEAIRIFQSNPILHPADMIDTLHVALRSTRGAAIGIAEFDNLNQVIRFAGAGNIIGSIVSTADDDMKPTRRNMVSHNGTVGHQIRRVQEFTYPWRKGDTLVLHSDGLISHWDLAKYPGFQQHQAGIAVGLLYRDYNRGRDDTTIVVVRQSEITA